MCWDHSFLGHITKIHMRFWQYSIEIWIHKDDRKVNMSFLLSFIVTKMNVKRSIHETCLGLRYTWTLQPVTNLSYLGLLLCMKMFDINLLVQVIPISLSGYPTVLWIKHYSSICKQYVLKNEAKDCIVQIMFLQKSALTNFTQSEIPKSLPSFHHSMYCG
jgi:hypothetical protein